MKKLAVLIAITSLGLLPALGQVPTQGCCKGQLPCCEKAKASCCKAEAKAKAKAAKAEAKAAKQAAKKAAKNNQPVK